MHNTFLLHNEIILSLVVSTLNKPGVLLSYFASVNDLPSTLNVGCNSLLSLGRKLYLSFSYYSLTTMASPFIAKMEFFHGPRP